MSIFTQKRRDLIEKCHIQLLAMTVRWLIHTARPSSFVLSDNTFIFFFSSLFYCIYCVIYICDAYYEFFIPPLKMPNTMVWRFGKVLQWRAIK